MKKHKKEKALTPEEEVAMIQRKLGYISFVRPKDSFNYLDLHNPDANEALGDREYGLRWGSIIELIGEESNGKSLLAAEISAIAQKEDPENTYIAKMDLEVANNNKFNARMGINLDKFYLFQPRLAVKLKDLGMRSGKRADKLVQSDLFTILKNNKKLSKQYQQSAEELCEEVEAWVKYKRVTNPNAKIILSVDSVTGLLVSEEDEGGLVDANMRTKVSLASFMSRLCRRWVRMAENYNMIIIFINQIRVAPGVIYGNPEYSPGGKALKFYASVRAKIRRAKSGRIKKGDEVIGIRGLVLNLKNRVGGKEFHSCGWKCYTRKGKFKWMTKDVAIKEASKK